MRQVLVLAKQLSLSDPSGPVTGDCVTNADIETKFDRVSDLRNQGRYLR